MNRIAFSGVFRNRNYDVNAFIMYEDIFAQIRNEAEKRNLKTSTINAYCNSVDYFLRVINKDISSLTTDDVDAFLTEKRLGGLAPRTYNHYMSSRNKNRKNTLCRKLLGCKKYLSKLKYLDASAIIRLLYNKDVCKCASCGGKIIPLSAEKVFIRTEPHLLC